MHTLRKILLKNPSSQGLWLALGLLFKGILPFIWLLHSHPICEIPGFWGGTGGDTSSYLKPIDNWLAHGIYTPDFRMPGYGLVYLIFRLITPTAIACNIILILQYLMASISIYILAITAKNIFGNNRIFYISFYFLLISNFQNYFDGFIQTESLCTSFLIFSAWFFTNYIHTKRFLHLFLSSIFLGWAVFMRPGFALLLPAFALLILFQKKGEIRRNIKYGFLFLLPFLIADSFWTYRNYVHFKKIVPLAYIGNYPNVAESYLQPMFYFTQSWGGAYSFGDKEPDLSWFDYSYPGRIKPLKYDSLPDDIYTSKYNKDSLLHLKKLIIALQNPLTDSFTAKLYQKELISKFNHYKASFQKEKPFTYYVATPIRLTGIFLYGAYTKKYLDRGQTLGQLNPIMRIFSTTLYLGTLLFGLIGMIFLLWAGLRKNILFVLIALFPLYTILIHPIFLRVPDTRFFSPTWSFLIVCAAFSISKIVKNPNLNNK